MLSSILSLFLIRIINSLLKPSAGNSTCTPRMEQLITTEFYLGIREKQLLPLELFGEDYNYQSAYWTPQVATIKEHSTTAPKVKISWRLICSLCVGVPWEILVKHPFLPKTALPQNNHLDNCISNLKHAKGKQQKVTHNNSVIERNISDIRFHIYHHTYKDLGS